LICGAIGDGIGAEFVQHRKFMAAMPSITDILSGHVTSFVIHNPKFEMQISYSICVQMCYELQTRAIAVERAYQGEKRDFNKFPARITWLEEADRGFNYAINHFRPDVTIMAANLAMTVHKLPLSNARMPKLSAFLDTYQDVI
jgi:hypothetical protein